MGNTRHEGVRMRYRDFEAIENADPDPIRVGDRARVSRRNSHRKAG